MLELGKNLKFYDKSGTNLNFKRVKGVWYGTVYFDTTSINLHENQQIYVLEQVYNTTTEQYDYTFPRGDNGASIRFSWQSTENEDNIWLYTIDYQTDPTYPLIQSVDQWETVLDDGTLDDITGADSGHQGFQSGSSLIRNIADSEIRRVPVQTNYALVSDVEGTFPRILRIDQVESNGDATKLAEILFYGGVEGEDERLKKTLENFGRDAAFCSPKIFREVDVDEDEADYKIINEKRKQLLIAGDEIFQYTGSYKGLVNAIKFFGYSDLRLKEYWLNIDKSSENYGKFKQEQIPFDFENVKVGSLLPNNTFKKTAKFGLFYDLNKETGELDEFGIPITEDAFQFSNEEVLLKLYSLKECLKNNFLPLNARIVDITGEGVYFERYAIEAWSNQNQTIDVDLNMDLTFNVEPKITYLEIIEPTTDYTGYEGSTIYDLACITIGELGPVRVGDFATGENRDYSLLGKNFKNNVGAKVTLNNTTFDVRWKDLNIAWQDIRNTDFELFSFAHSWGTIGRGDIYEIEWRVTLTGSFDRSFTYVKRGTVDEMDTHTLYLPYSGTYDVEMVLHETTGKAYPLFKKDAITVRMYGGTPVALWKSYDIRKTFSTLDMSWNNAGFSWMIPTKNSTTWRTAKVKWSDYDYGKYLDQEFFSDVKQVNIDRINHQEKQIVIPGNYVDGEGVGSPTLYANQFIILRNMNKPITADVVDIGDTVTISNVGDPTNYYVSILSSPKAFNVTFDNEDTRVFGTISYFEISGDWTGKIFSGDEFEILYDGYTEWKSYTLGAIDYMEDFGVTVISFVSQNPGEPKTLSSTMKGTVKFRTNATRLLVESTTNNGSTRELNLRDPSGALVTLSELYDQGELFSIFWNDVQGEYGFYVNSLYYADGYTYVNVSDPNGKLQYLDKGFVVRWTEFDYDYARTWAGVRNEWNAKSWNNLSELKWRDLFARTWDSFDYHPSVLAGFIIETVAPGGKIQINDGPVFEFPDTNGLTLYEAMKALNNSEIPEIAQFDYSIAVIDDSLGVCCFVESGPQGPVYTPYYCDTPYGELETGFQGVQGYEGVQGPQGLYYPYYLDEVVKNPTYVIFATARHAGTKGLAYIRYKDGVKGSDCEYDSIGTSMPLGSINSKITGEVGTIGGWDPRTSGVWRIWNRYKKTYPSDEQYSKWGAYDNRYRAFRSPYTSSMNGSFTWSSTHVEYNRAKVPIAVPVFFVPGSVKTVAPERYIWRLYDSDSGTLLIETEKDYLIWTFDRVGDYTLSMQIVDVNGNVYDAVRYSFLNVYDKIEDIECEECITIFD